MEDLRREFPEIQARTTLLGLFGDPPTVEIADPYLAEEAVAGKISEQVRAGVDGLTLWIASIKATRRNISVGQMLIPEKNANGSSSAVPLCAYAATHRTMIGVPQITQKGVLEKTRASRCGVVPPAGKLRWTLLALTQITMPARAAAAIGHADALAIRSIGGHRRPGNSTADYLKHLGIGMGVLLHGAGEIGTASTALRAEPVAQGAVDAELVFAGLGRFGVTRQRIFLSDRLERKRQRERRK